MKKQLNNVNVICWGKWWVHISKSSNSDYGTWQSAADSVMTYSSCCCNWTSHHRQFNKVAWLERLGNIQWLGCPVGGRPSHDLSVSASLCADKVDKNISDDQQEQRRQCEKVATKQSCVTELPSQESVTPVDHGSESDTTTYAEAVNQWTTVHKKAKTVPTKTMQRGSAITESAKNVMIQSETFSCGPKVLPGLLLYLDAVGCTII